MSTEHSVAAALEKVLTIDLLPINKVLHHENPSLWTEGRIAATEANYRRLLALNIVYPSEEHVVNKLVDDYWHQHILDTSKYAEDCQTLFGKFLHHDPYFGLNGPEDLQRNRDGFALTQQLWEEVFGVPMVDETTLTIDKVLGSYDPEPKDARRNRIYAYPQGCKNGQHCQRTLVEEPFINPAINPRINPQNNPQIRAPVPPLNEFPTGNVTPG
jgi:hypothetical protein